MGSCDVRPEWEFDLTAADELLIGGLPDDVRAAVERYVRCSRSNSATYRRAIRILERHGHMAAAGVLRRVPQ